MPPKTRYFYPRSPCGERPNEALQKVKDIEFLSTLSLRRATTGNASGIHTHWISIHALLAESDLRTPPQDSRLLTFLSTLSLRRATLADCTKIYAVGDFYPRSPCGERLRISVSGAAGAMISIHALLAESDNINSSVNTADKISIHALLAESDMPITDRIVVGFEFLSTLSLRRATKVALKRAGDGAISIHALLAESDIGTCTSI